MAEVPIKISLDLGDLTRLAEVQRQADAARRALEEQRNAQQRQGQQQGQWETLPGGGIRKVGYREQPAQSALGDYIQMPDGRLVKKGWEGRVQPGTGATPPQAQIQQAQIQQAQQTTQQAIQETRQYTRTIDETGRTTGQLNDNLRNLNTNLTHPRGGGGGPGGVPPGTGATAGGEGGPPGRRPLSGRALSLLGAGAQLPAGEVRRPAPPEPPDEDGGGGGWGMVRRGWGRVSGVARQALTLAVGLNAYTALTHAMELYERRARGIISVGSQLSQNFDEIGAGIDSLRDKYQITSRESLPAMEALGRVTGGLAGLQGIGAYSAAYGVAPVHAAEQTARLQRQTIGAGGDPLALLGRLAGQIGNVGFKPMPLPNLADEAARMAEMGAALGSRVPIGVYGRQAALIGSLGEQYQVPGAISGVGGQLARGLNQAPNEAVYSLRWNAIQRYAQQHGNTFSHGGKQYDLSDPFDVETLMEQLSNVPQLKQAVMDEIDQSIQGQPNLRRRMVYEAFAGQQTTRQFARDLSDATVGRQNVFAREGAGTQAEEAAVRAEMQQRLETRRQRPEFLPQAAEAQLEGGLEPVGKRLVTLSIEMQTAIVNMGKSMADGATAADALTKGLGKISRESYEILGVLTTLSAKDWWQALLGLAVTGAAQSDINIPEGLQQLDKIHKMITDIIYQALPVKPTR